MYHLGFYKPLMNVCSSISTRQDRTFTIPKTTIATKRFISHGWSGWNGNSNVSPMEHTEATQRGTVRQVVGFHRVLIDIF